MIPMKPTPLSQLAIVSAGQAAPKSDEFSDYGTPFVRAGSLDRLLSGEPESGLELVSEETAKQRKLKTYPRGTVLFAKSGMSATKDRVYVLQNPAHVVSHLATLIPKKGTHVGYLRFALKHFPPSSLIKDHAYPAIGLGDIEDFKIPVPDSSDDQIRIAHLLGKVEGLIAKRKQHLQQLDDLLKSVFLEIFGDPVRNEKGWPISPLVTYMSEQPNNGLYKPQSSYGSGTKIIRIDSFYDGIVQNIEGLKRVEITDSEFLKFEIRPFDVLVNRVNSIEYLGKIGVVPAISEPVVYESNMMRFRLNHEVMLPVFLMYFWRTPYLKSQINSKAKKAVNQASVNQQDVAGLLVSQPPIDLQNQFAVVVEKVEALKTRYQQSLSDLEALYSALSQKAFQGELDLSRVPMPKSPTQDVSAVSQGDQATVPEPVMQTAPAIHLPDTGKLLEALENAEARTALIAEWLDAYREQLAGTAFSAQHFMVVAQTRLAELHLDNDFVLGASDYEHIRAWVFEALAAGTLTQVFDDAGNCIELKAAIEQSQA